MTRSRARLNPVLQLLEDSSVSRGGQNDLFIGTSAVEEEPQSDAVRDELGKINPVCGRHRPIYHSSSPSGTVV